jgi:hypothetical protein
MVAGVVVAMSTLACILPFLLGPNQ